MIMTIFGIIGTIVVIRAVRWLIALPFRLLFGDRKTRYIEVYDEYYDWW